MDFEHDDDKLFSEEQLAGIADKHENGEAQPILPASLLDVPIRELPLPSVNK